MILSREHADMSPEMLEKCKRAKKLDMEILLDFHYIEVLNYLKDNDITVMMPASLFSLSKS